MYSTHQHIINQCCASSDRMISFQSTSTHLKQTIQQRKGLPCANNNNNNWCLICDLLSLSSILIFVLNGLFAVVKSNAIFFWNASFVEASSSSSSLTRYAYFHLLAILRRFFDLNTHCKHKITHYHTRNSIYNIILLPSFAIIWEVKVKF